MSLEDEINKEQIKIAYDRLTKLRKSSKTPEEFAASYIGEMGTPEFSKKLEKSLRKALYPLLGLTYKKGE